MQIWVLIHIVRYSAQDVESNLLIKKLIKKISIEVESNYLGNLFIAV